MSLSCQTFKDFERLVQKVELLTPVAEHNLQKAFFHIEYDW